MTAKRNGVDNACLAVSEADTSQHSCLAKSAEEAVEAPRRLWERVGPKEAGGAEGAKKAEGAKEAGGAEGARAMVGAGGGEGALRAEKAGRSEGCCPVAMPNPVGTISWDLSARPELIPSLLLGVGVGQNGAALLLQELTS